MLGQLDAIFKGDFMKSIKWHKFIVITIMLLFYACGKSPFLDEKTSTNSPRTDLPRSSQSVDTVLVSAQNLVINDRGEQNSIEIITESAFLHTIWTVPPSEAHEAKLIITISSPDGDRIDVISEVKVFLWMPDMGHGSAPVKIKKLYPGIYELSNIYFIMPGFWEFHIQFIYNNAIQSEVVWPINI